MFTSNPVIKFLENLSQKVNERANVRGPEITEGTEKISEFVKSIREKVDASIKDAIEMEIEFFQGRIKYHEENLERNKAFLNDHLKALEIYLVQKHLK